MTKPDHLFDYAKQIDIAAADAINVALGRLPINEREQACVAIMVAGIVSGRALYATQIGNAASDEAHKLLEVAHLYGMQDAAAVERKQRERG